MPRIIPIVFALACAAPVRAELLYRDFAALRAQDAQAADRLLALAGDALHWANAVLEIEGKPRLYCPPSRNRVGLESYRRILADAVGDTTPENAAAVDLPILLLTGLRAAWPCRGAETEPGRSRAP